MTNSDLTGNPATGLQVNLQTSIASADSDGFQLDIDVLMPGQGVTAIFGPSGSGKTTLLRCIAGLSKADSGKLVINGDTWQAGGRFLPPHQRNLGYVFQEASLFAHLNVAQNIRYGIKRRKTNISDHEYQQILQMLGIAGLSTRMPDKLSGGERQRVAIARALVTKPKLLLMDEPLSSLDDALKQQILPYLEQLKRVTDIPILYVTHSMQEVSRLADQVVLLQRGTVQAQGSVNEVFSQQQCDNDAFIGTVIHVTASAKDDKWHLIRFSFADNHLWLADSGEELQQAYRVRIPASDVSIALHAESHSSILNRLKATLISISPCAHPARCLVKLMVGSQPLVAQITRRSASELSLKPDMSVWVQIKSAAIIR